MTEPQEPETAQGPGGVVAKATAALGEVRRRRPFVDHGVRAFGRYNDDRGDRLASGVTYFGFLSFFPLVALAFSITGFVVDAYPAAQRKVTEQIDNYLPGLSDKLNVSTIGHAKVGVGLIGLAGLLLSGLGWIDAIRDAIRKMWHQADDGGNILSRKVRDVGDLAGFGLTVVVSVAATSLATSATGVFLRWVGLGGSVGAHVVTSILAVAVALAVDVVTFLYLFLRLAGVSEPRRRVLRGALLGAAGLELLKIGGAWLIGRTTSNPVYGTFAVIVGLLIWINILSRWTLFVAAWTVTAPYETDVPPSGSAPEPSL